jgi:hypothetical protein
VQDVERQTCSERSNFSERRESAYRDALRRTAEDLYGPRRGELGSKHQHLVELERVLSDPEQGPEVARKLQDRLRSLRQTRDRAQGARHRYLDLAEEVSRAEGQLRQTARTRPQSAVDAALEHLAGMYEAGVRVVVRSSSGRWRAHPMYDRPFEPALDRRGVARDGRLYISASEVERVMGRSGGLHDYRGVSRLFHVHEVLETQLGWLGRMGEQLERTCDTWLDAEDPRTGRRLGDLLAPTPNTVDEFRRSYTNLVNQELGRLARAHWTLHDRVDIWAFAQDHPDVRIRTLAASPEFFPVDCGLQHFSNADWLLEQAAWAVAFVRGASIGRWIARALLGTVSSWVGVVATVSVMAISGFALAFTLAQDALQGHELMSSAEAAGNRRDSELWSLRSPVELWAPLFGAVARGAWTATQMAAALKQTEGDSSLRACIAGMGPDELAGLDADRLVSRCRGGSTSP